jgi:hypothetical protein
MKHIAIFSVLVLALSISGCNSGGGGTTPTGWSAVFSDDFDRADVNGATDSNLGHSTADTWNAWADNGTIQIVSAKLRMSGDAGSMGDVGAEYKTKINSTKVKLVATITTPDDVESNFTTNNFVAMYDDYSTNGSGCPVAGILSTYNDDKYILQLLDASNSNTQVAASTTNIGLSNSTDYILTFQVVAGVYTFALSNSTGTEIESITYTGSSCTFENGGFTFNYNTTGKYMYLDDFSVSTQ